MIICDRCGKKITNKTDKTKQTLFIYKREAAGIWNNVDLCKDCLTEWEDFKQIAESHFMVNKDNAIEVLKKVKYWSD